MEHGEQRPLNWLIKGTEYTNCDVSCSSMHSNIFITFELIGY